MTLALNATSLQRLASVHPDLQRVVNRAVTLSAQPFFIVEGARTREEMCVNWGRGRSAAECVAANVPASYAQPAAAKVTWLRDPFMSNHRVMPDGFGHAVDLGALVDGKYDGAHQAPYDAIAAAMLKAASIERVHIRWGGNWDEDATPHEHGETDLAHFELMPPLAAAA